MGIVGAAADITVAITEIGDGITVVGIGITAKGTMTDHTTRRMMTVPTIAILFTASCHQLDSPSVSAATFIEVIITTGADICLKVPPRSKSSVRRIGRRFVSIHS